MTAAKLFRIIVCTLVLSIHASSLARAQSRPIAASAATGQNSWISALADAPAVPLRKQPALAPVPVYGPWSKSVASAESKMRTVGAESETDGDVQLAKPDLKALSTELQLAVPPSITPEIEKRQHERDEGYRKLKQQLQDLMERVERRKNFEPSPEPNDRPSATQQTPAEVLPPAAAKANDESAEEIAPEQLAPEVVPPEDDLQAAKADQALSPVIEDVVDIQAEEKAKADSRSVFLDSLKAATVVDGPVDRIGLADNLYALGELTIALEMYQKVNTTDVTASERYWVAFQRASCHRRLGQRDESRELYRRIAGQESAGWLAKTSRWWLDQMDLREQLETKIVGQAEVIKKFSELYPQQTANNVPEPQPGI